MLRYSLALTALLVPLTAQAQDDPQPGDPADRPAPEADPADPAPQPDPPAGLPGDLQPDPGAPKLNELRIFEQRLLMAAEDNDLQLFETLVLDADDVRAQVEASATPQEEIEKELLAIKALSTKSFNDLRTWLRDQRFSAGLSSVFRRIDNGVVYGRFQRPVIERYDLLFRCQQDERRYFVSCPITRVRVGPRQRITRLCGPLAIWRDDQLLEITVERYERFAKHLIHRYRLIPRSPSSVVAVFEIAGERAHHMGVTVPEDVPVQLDVIECLHTTKEEKELRLEMTLRYTNRQGKTLGRRARWHADLPRKGIRFARDMTRGRRAFAGPGYSPRLFSHWYHEPPDKDAPPKPNVSTLGQWLAVRVEVHPNGPRVGGAFKDTAHEGPKAPLVPTRTMGMGGETISPSVEPAQPEQPLEDEAMDDDVPEVPAEPVDAPTEETPEGGGLPDVLRPTGPDETPPAEEPPEEDAGPEPEPRPRPPPKDYIG